MKISLCMMFMAGLVVGCGDSKVVNVPGPATPVVQDFEGLWMFKDSGSSAESGPLELVAKYDQEVQASQVSNNDKLVSKNFNGTYGTHPRISFSDAFVNSNCLVKAFDVTYASSEGLDLDGTATDLPAGKHYTVYRICLGANSSLTLSISIYDGYLTLASGIGSIVISRDFRSI